MDNSFLHRKKLLLVDDEPDLLKMVSDILSDAGFETVLTAATVKEAIITWSYVKKKYKLNTTNFLFLCNC